MSEASYYPQAYRRSVCLTLTYSLLEASLCLGNILARSGLYGENVGLFCMDLTDSRKLPHGVHACLFGKICTLTGYCFLFSCMKVKNFEQRLLVAVTSNSS